MLLANAKPIPANVNKDKDPDMYVHYMFYQEKLKELLARFPKGEVALKRNGYPKVSPAFIDDSLAKGLPEMPTPIYFKLTKTVGDVTWGYCKGRPIIHPNGLMEVPPNDNTEVFNNLIEKINIKKNPEFAFFVVYISGLVGSQFKIHDPDGDKLEALRKKNARMAVSNSIWMNMSDEKVRMMAQAWRVKDAGNPEKDILLVKDELEKKVFKGEEAKLKDRTNLQLKGIDEFLMDARSDEFTRPKAVIGYGIEEQRITYSKNHFYFDGKELCNVPYGWEDAERRPEYLAQFFRDPNHKEEWLMVLKGLMNKEYVEAMDKYGKRWLAGQFGIAINKKEEDLLKALLDQFAD